MRNTAVETAPYLRTNTLTVPEPVAPANNYRADIQSKMTENTTEDAPEGVSSVVDHESLRNHDEIPFHEDRAVVEKDLVETFAEMDDLAAVGVTNPAGELLCRRMTETCSWKIPVETVDAEDDFAEAILSHVEETLGFSLELDDVAGVWDSQLETEDGTKSASRAFVTFSASPASDSYDLVAATPTGESVEEAGWFEELPEEASKIPGTDLFLG